VLLKVKDVVIGLGEIGSPLYKILSNKFPTAGYDLKPELTKNMKNKKIKDFQTEFLHICIPHSQNFTKIIKEHSKNFQAKGIVIHSTIPPGTTEKLQNKVDVPVIFSATRGVHKRMIKDMKKYSKFYSVYNWAPKSKWASKTFEKRMKNVGIKTTKMSSPRVLELAKIVVDTSYYGWMINYAQLSNMIAIQNNVDYDEMWSFADEIHKFLGNRPKLFPGYIGGHCIIPNLDLIDENSLAMVKKINDLYLKKIKNAKSIYKKYAKGE